MRFAWITLALLLFQLACHHVQLAFSEICIYKCTCTSENIECHELDVLHRIPVSVPRKYSKLSIQKPVFDQHFINHRNFTNLTHLTHLKIIQGNIEYIESNTFRGLSQLIYLEISNNPHLKIHDYAFSGLRLETLYLENNLYLKLTSNTFLDLRVKKLSLRENRMRHLSYDHVKNLGLTHLYLYNNQLNEIDINFNKIFHRSGTIFEVSRNPLSCKCGLFWIWKKLHNGSYSNLANWEMQNSNVSCLQADGSYHNLLSISPLHLGCRRTKIQELSISSTSMGYLHVTCLADGNPLPSMSVQSMNGESGYEDKKTTNMLKVDRVSSTWVTKLSSGTNQSIIRLNCSTENKIPSSHQLLVKIDMGNFLRGVQNRLQVNGNISSSLDYSESINQFASTNNNVKPIWSSSSSSSLSLSLFFDKRFTLLELLAAILSTFTLTLMLAFIVIHFCASKTKTLHSNKFFNQSRDLFHASFAHKSYCKSNTGPQHACLINHNVSCDASAAKSMQQSGHVNSFPTTYSITETGFSVNNGPTIYDSPNEMLMPFLTLPPQPRVPPTS